MGRVVVLGSLNADVVTRVERHPRPGETVLGEGLRRLAGGKGANQAMAAAAAGGRVVMVGAVGADPAGSAYVDRLRGAGIDVSGVAVRDEEPTGTAIVVVDGAGENAIVVVPGANATVGPDQLDDLSSDDVLLVQLEVPVGTVVAACRTAHASGVRVVLNMAPYDDLPDDLVALADPVVVNEHEASLLAASGASPRSLLVTLGSEGATWGDLRLPAERVDPDEVVDTTGAGDAFCGALAAALADGQEPEPALRLALAAGARAVRHEGAQPDPELG